MLREMFHYIACEGCDLFVLVAAASLLIGALWLARAVLYIAVGVVAVIAGVTVAAYERICNR